jgi:hypothetical protein
LFWIFAAVFILLSLPSYYGFIELWSKHVLPKYSHRQNPAIFAFTAFKLTVKGYYTLLTQLPRLLLHFTAYLLQHTWLKIFRQYNSRIDKQDDDVSKDWSVIVHSFYTVVDNLAFVTCVPVIVLLGPWRILPTLTILRQSTTRTYFSILLSSLLTVLSDIPYALMTLILALSVIGLWNLYSKLPEDKSSENYDIDVKEAIYRCFV